MSLSVGTKVKVRAFEAEVVDGNDECLGLEGLDMLDEGFVVVRDDEGIVHALWVDGCDSIVVQESYVDGFVYCDAECNFFMFDESYGSDPDQWLVFGADSGVPFDKPVRPLTRIGLVGYSST